MPQGERFAAVFKKGTDPKDLCPIDHLAQQHKELDTEEEYPLGRAR